MNQKSVLVGLLSLWTLSACGGAWMPAPSGRVVTEERTVEAFDRVEIDDSLRATIRVGPERSLRVTTDDNRLQYLVTRVVGDQLILGIASGYAVWDREIYDIEITTPTLRGMVADGAAQLIVSGLNAPELDITADGASIIEATGTAGNMRLDASGSSRLALKNLAASDATAIISGSSTLDVCATDDLDLHVSGSSRVVYRCNPRTVTTDVTGSSTAVRE